MGVLLFSAAVDGSGDGQWPSAQGTWPTVLSAGDIQVIFFRLEGGPADFTWAAQR